MDRLLIRREVLNPIYLIAEAQLYSFGLSRVSMVATINKNKKALSRTLLLSSPKPSSSMRTIEMPFSR